MIRGADISEYRLVTDIDRYLDSGRSFLAFKATGGSKGWNYTDPTLAQNLAIVKTHGLHAIAYHFLREGDGRVQADHFLGKVPHRGVVLVCDFEPHPPSNSFPTAATLAAFVHRVREVTGRWPWVYTSSGSWGALVRPATTRVAPECPLWAADWTAPLDPISYGGWTKAVLWQYTDSEPVPGISAPCDDNILRGTELDLLRGAWGSENVSAQDRGWGPPCPQASIVNIKPTATRSFNVHRRVAKIFDTFVRELESRGYDIEAGQLDDWSYNCRKIAGSDSWSNHAWGLAIDINSLKNPMGSTLVTDMPAWVRDAGYLLRKYGLKWGGTYVNRPDAMHFEFILTPADADRITAALGDEDDMFETADRTTLNDVETKLDALRRDLSVFGTSGLEETVEHFANRQREALTLLRSLQDDEAKVTAAIGAAAGPIAAQVVASLQSGGVLQADVDEAAVAAAVSAAVVQAVQKITFTATTQDQPTG